MIGYYIHHQGVGHLTRASSIGPLLGEAVTVLSSRPEPAAHPFDGWVSLPMDTGPDPVDPTARGTLHWAPIGVPGMTDRMAAVARWVAENRPTVMVVDVSVEIALFVRLMGIPVVVFAMPGERTDAPHTAAYRVASRIVAPWSRDVYDPPWLHPFADKTVHTGFISRFAGRADRTAAVPNSVLVLGGAGGSALTPEALDLARAHTPDHTWFGAGVPGSDWVDDVWPLLTSASVVITHAGQNAVADVAAARTPAVVVPQDRPFDEQAATARALDRAGVAVGLGSWPDPARWESILVRAQGLSSDGWEAAGIDGAAARAADAITSVT